MSNKKEHLRLQPPESAFTISRVNHSMWLIDGVLCRRAQKGENPVRYVKMLNNKTFEVEEVGMFPIKS